MSRLQVVVLGGKRHGQPSQEGVLASVLGHPGVDVGWMTHEHLEQDTPERRRWTEGHPRMLILGWEDCEAFVARLSQNESLRSLAAAKSVADVSSWGGDSGRLDRDAEVELSSDVAAARLWYVCVRGKEDQGNVVQVAAMTHRKLAAGGIRLTGQAAPRPLGLPVVQGPSRSSVQDRQADRMTEADRQAFKPTSGVASPAKAMEKPPNALETEPNALDKAPSTSEEELDGWIDQLDQHFADPDA